eukprot:COSAG04_NODE_515_length_13209_cov_19.059115_18_plen_78_part_00
MMGMISAEGRAVAAEAVGEQYRAVRRQVSCCWSAVTVHWNAHSRDSHSVEAVSCDATLPPSAELIRVQHSPLSLERD